ncbi:MAG: acetylornithine deacetylase [Pseudomonadota bacterium]
MTTTAVQTDLPSDLPLDLIESFIGFDTVSRHSNMQLIDFVRDYLGKLGVSSKLVPNEDGSKANLYATIGPNEPGGVVLSGHTDVVPVDGQSWSTNPFKLVDGGDRYFGRGTCDMKTFCALAMGILPEFLERAPKKPIHLAFSYDEELGCIGAPSMIEKMVDDVPEPMAVIVGEPTDMKVVTGHKSIMGVTTHVTGKSVHSCQVDRGVSAVMTAARLITYLEDMMLENARRADPQSPFDPPYTTIHCGVVEGGTARNIVAKECTLVTDIRTIAGEHPMDFYKRYETHIREEVEPRMKAIAPEAQIVVTPAHVVPGLEPEADGGAERIARQITGDNGVHAVSYATEAGQFQTAGFSVAICGPGSIDQAHQPDEFITKDQLAQGWQFMKKLTETLS